MRASPSASADASRARLQAWCINLLSLQCQAYALGEVLGAGTRYRGRGRAILAPAALVLADGGQGDVTDAAIGDVPALAVVIGEAEAPTPEMEIDRYAKAGTLELWVLHATRRDAPEFYQRSVGGVLERIAPDAHGDYFSALGESVVIPVRWFSELPSLWDMMRHWGMLTD